jgi:hypothetical protein
VLPQAPLEPVQGGLVVAEGRMHDRDVDRGDILLQRATLECAQHLLRFAPATGPRVHVAHQPCRRVASNASIAVDASFNRVWTVPITPTLGAPAVLVNFAPVPNTLPALGAPVSEAVPASIREVGNDYLVSLLTGFPFGPGAASVWRVKPFHRSDRTCSHRVANRR